MKNPVANFDRLARIYRALEFIAFGHDLERARFCLLEELSACRSLLVLGEGDGRCLERLLKLAPAAQIHCVDASPAMLAAAAARIASAEDRARVRFEIADARQLSLSAASYDGVVTLFFLDCFSVDDAARLIARVSAALKPDSLWLYADFAVPEKFFARCRAQLWLALLYTFFRWQTGLRVRALPPAENLIRAAGFDAAATHTRQAGLLRTVLFRRGGHSGVQGVTATSTASP